jgi:putative transposase
MRQKSPEHHNLTPDQKQEVIEMLAQDYPVTMTCDVLGCARSSYYHPPTERAGEAELRAAIKTVAAKWPTYGYRRVTAQLQRQDWIVNHKRVQRLMRLMDIQAKTKGKKRRTTNSEHDFPCYPNLVQDLEIVRPEQVWVSDITYVCLRHDFVYLAVIMDVFTRGTRGWHLGRSLDYTLTLTALQRALAKHSAPEIHHSDQGVQYAAMAYTQALQDVKVQVHV